MGYYLSFAKPTGKAERCMIDHGGMVLSKPALSTNGRVTICVVSNLLFDAALVCHEQYEIDRVLRAQKQGDHRPCVWLSIPQAEVLKLCPEVAPELPPAT